MKQIITDTWRKPWGKALIAVLYSAASILLYFVIAQIVYEFFGTTIVPDIGHPTFQSQSMTPAEMQRLNTNIPYTGPGSPNYQPPAPGTAYTPGAAR